MQYRQLLKNGKEVSILGLGGMRFPTKTDGSMGPWGPLVDEEKTIEVIRHAIDNGITYLDTAYNYLGGDSERIIGKALKDGYREKVFLVSKSPTWLFKSEEDFDKHLNEQLERLQTDYIDMYLLHSQSARVWRKTVAPYNVLEKLDKAKAEGKIKATGFSFHDSYSAFEEMVNAYPWDMCQIQLNYIDTEYQAGLKGLEYAASKGIKVVIMEPLRGGYLAKLPERAEEARAKQFPNETTVQSGLNFLWNRPEIACVLSGMSSIEMLDENIKYANEFKEDDKHTKEAYQGIKDALASYGTIPCTGCAYCYECPKGIGIPWIFSIYNEYKTTGDIKKGKFAYNYQLRGFGAKADRCVDCKSCESHCPQHLEITKLIKEVHEVLNEEKK